MGQKFQKAHEVDQFTLKQLRVAHAGLTAMIEEYEDAVFPLSRVEAKLRNSMHVLKTARTSILSQKEF